MFLLFHLLKYSSIKFWDDLYLLLVDCKHASSQWRADIHHLESQLRRKDQLLRGFVAAATAQAKHMSPQYPL